MDVSSILIRDHKTGIQRSTRNLFLALCSGYGAMVNFIPVYATVWGNGYFLAQSAPAPQGVRFLPTKEPVRPAPGDVFFALDFSPVTVLAQLAALKAMKARGMALFFLLHDIIPIQHGGWFPPGTKEIHSSWLRETAHLGQIICVSKTVRAETRAWLKAQGVAIPHNHLHWFHHGFDWDNFSATDIFERRRPPALPYILTVGTIEPRKGHEQILKAFELLWEEGENTALVIAGQAGWKVDNLCRLIRQHPQSGKLLFWFEYCGDGLLGQLYAQAMGILIASRAEGFGLPLLEGAAYKKPLILRDLPIFHELAGENAFYFQGDTPAALADSLRQWLKMHKAGAEPPPPPVPEFGWQKPARTIFDIIISKE